MISGSRKQHRVGLVLFRVVCGSAVLVQLCLTFGSRDVLLGGDGILPYTPFKEQFLSSHVSLLALSPSITWTSSVYAAAVTAFAAWTLGYGTRFLTPCCWLLLHSIHARNPYILDGGDNAVQILLLYASLCDLSNLSTAERGSLGCQAAAETATRRGRLKQAYVRNVLHNSGVALLTLQVCTIYFVAGAGKLTGQAWIDGTALYYVTSSQQFGSALVRDVIVAFPLLGALGTWAPLLLQLSFPWIVLFGRERPRRGAILAAIIFHLGILASMSLVTFALTMIAAELALLKDSDARAFIKSLSRLRSARTLRTALTRATRLGPSALRGGELRTAGDRQRTVIDDATRNDNNTTRNDNEQENN